MPRPYPRTDHVAWAAACAIAALVLSPAAARAESRTSSLSWVRMGGADSCVATQDLARYVEARLGRAVFVSAAQADVSVEGHIEPNRGGPGFHATVSLRDAKGALLGTRELTKKEASCDEMRAPLALVIAVMIDPDAALKSKPEPPPLPPPEPTVIVKEKTVYVEVPAPPKESGPPATASPPQRPAKPTWETEIDLSFASSVGLLPSAGPGVGLSAIILPPRGPAFSIDSTYFFGTEATAERGAKATFTAGLGALGVCPLARHGDVFSIFACAALGLGAEDVKSTGFDTQRGTQSRIIFVPSLDVRGSARVVGPLRVSLALSALFPVTRDSFVYDRGDGTQGRIFQASPIGGKAAAGLGVAF